MNASKLKIFNTIDKYGAEKSQREFSKITGLSVGNVNSSLCSLRKAGLIDEENHIQEKSAQKFKTKSAVILAAGFGFRMLPLNTILPKALLSVNGETIIERIINQLKEVDIKDIYIVVGYQKEKFEYLIDRYNVNLIVNSHYAEDNNCFSLYLARNKLSSSYIVPGDLYFIENPFNKYEEESYYALSNTSTDSDYFSLDSKNNIVKREIDDTRKHFKAVGLAFISNQDQHICQTALEKLVSSHMNSYWEDIMLIKYGLKLKPIFINNEVYKEINTFEDLRKIDSSSKDLENEHIKTIEKVFGITLDKIENVSLMKKGMTNRSLMFNIGDDRYIMRIPGEGTSQLINRRNEYESYQVIKDKHISDDVIYMNPDNGVKITKYIPNTHNCDPANKDEVFSCIKFLKSFHDLKLKCDHDFDIFGQIDWYEKLRGDTSLYSDYAEVKKSVLSLKSFIDSLSKEKVLCHIDSVPDNFLIDQDGNIRLIDWEYSSMNDPHLDIAMFAIYAGYDKTMIDFLIDSYFDNQCDEEIRYKIYAYVASAGFLWSNWCEYKHTLGVEFGEYSLMQYRYAKEYSKLVLNYLKDGKHD